MISFVLPAYNEAANLPALLEKIAAAMAQDGRPYRVVAVDDGSRDETPGILRRYAEQMPVEVVTHPVNRGLPQTILDGLRYAADSGAPEDVVVTMDADNSHEPDYAPNLATLVERGFDVVVASRYRPGARELGLSFARRFLSYGVNLMLAFLLPIPGVRDYTCGYRAYRVRFLRRLLDYYGDHLVTATTFAAMAEILLKAGTLKAQATEVPLVLRYDQKRGGSKMKVLRTILDYLWLIARMAPGWPATRPRPAPRGERP